MKADALATSTTGEPDGIVAPVELIDNVAIAGHSVPDWASASTHDFRDRGNPMKKIYPVGHWSRVDEEPTPSFNVSRGCREV